MLSDKSIKGLLYNLPINVHFAGFVATTTQLSREGWDLSLSEMRLVYDGRHALQLALRQGSREKGLYMLSQPLQLDPMRLYSNSRDSHEFQMNYQRMIVETGFHIAYAVNEISVRLAQPARMMNAFDTFQAFDPSPTIREEEFSVKDFKFFKTHIEEPKELIIDPSQVHQMLELILKSQSTQQKQIRDNERREEYLGLSRVKPAHTVHAQLISLVS